MHIVTRLTAKLSFPMLTAQKSSLIKSTTQLFTKFKTIPIAAVIRWRDIKKGRKSLVSISEDATVQDYLHKLASNELTAIPVFSEESKNWTGIVSTYDLLVFTIFRDVFKVLDTVDSQFESGIRNLEPEVANEAWQTFLKYEDQQKEFFKSPLKQVLGQNAESTKPFLIHSGDLLSDLLAKFTESNLHRILVVDESHVAISDWTRAYTMITQTDVLDYIHSNNEILGKKDWEELLQVQTGHVEELSRSHESDPVQATQGAKHVITVPDKIETIVAMRKMYLNRVSSLAIVNEPGKIIGNFSVSDIKLILNQDLETLKLPILDYLEHNWNAKKRLTYDQAVRCAYPMEPLKLSIETMLKDRIHHVWIVDEKEAPIGVLSMSDVLSLMNPTLLLEK